MAFEEQDVLHDRLRVDIGHVYPKELGGQLVTLECRRCNGKLNNAADNAYVRHHKDWDAVRPDRLSENILPAMIPMPSGNVNVEVSFGQIVGHFSRSAKDPFAELVATMASGGRFTVQYRAADPSRLNLGTLHSAHLLLFHEFGYGYLGSPGGQWVRQWLLADKLPSPAPYLATDVYAGGPIGVAQHFRCGTLTYANGDSCVFVVFPSADHNVQCTLVLLPGPTKEQLACYYRMYAVHGERSFRGSYRLFESRPNRLRLEQPEYAFRLQFLTDGSSDFDFDVTMIMHAIRAQVEGGSSRKVDAAPIGKRLGWDDDRLRCVLEVLIDGRCLERVPKPRQPRMIRLTPEGLGAL